MSNNPELPSSSVEAVRFVADARLLSILGEQLIGSEKVGLLELVKNAYDARATHCVVTIEGVPQLEPPQRTLPEYQELAGPIIEIRDDGSGMTRNDIVNGWLRPATANRGKIKERLRKERAEAKQRGALETYETLVEALREEYKGRIPLGEKGVGRLATHRLGRLLWLRTKTHDDPLEWELRVDWNDYDTIGSEPKDLSAVPLELRHQAPTTEYGLRGSGTVIVCYGGREGYEWTLDALTDIARALTGLQSARSTAEFSVSFKTPHVDPALLDSPVHFQAPFELLALVDEDGFADIDLTFSPPEHLEHAPKAFRRLDHLDLRTKSADYWLNGDSKPRAPRCGAFLIHAFCWIRIRDWLGPDYRDVTTYLNKYGGLAIYRDGILAQPAQQTSRSDWLGLAGEQIKKSSKLSYYQMIGEIEIEQSKTLDLRDRSSREGMIETEAYHDLGELTKGVLSELQFHTRLVRSEWIKHDRAHGISTATVHSASKASSRLLSSMVDTYDFAKDVLRIKTVEPRLRSQARMRAAAIALKAIPEVLALHQEERNGLLEAAGFGLAVAVGVHEMARVASGISSECRAIAKDSRQSDALSSRLRQVSTRADSLLTEIRRIAPLRTARTETVQQVSVRKAIDAALSAFETSLEEAKVSVVVEGDDFVVGARFGALAQVFANLLDNAIYWMSTVDRKRMVRVIVSSAERSILFGDSGPGVSEKMKPVLFQPFYSEKSPPSGLGLYICKYYLGQLRASIRGAKLGERSDLPGAQFLLSFSKSAEGQK